MVVDQIHKLHDIFITGNASTNAYSYNEFSEQVGGSCITKI